MISFRDLRADEIDCRLARVTSKGIQLLLYKDARCDMNILDETLGVENWQRHHTRDNQNCIVSIWDESKQQWIEKEDTGTESFTEKDKGLASDSFKRACFNLGIGRELYTSPFIWIQSGKGCDVKNVNGKDICNDKFAVESVQIENKRITGLRIINAKTKEICYTFGKIMSNRTTESSQEKRDIEVANQMIIDVPKIATLRKKMQEKNVSEQQILDRYKVESIEKMNFLEWSKAMKALDASKG